VAEAQADRLGQRHLAVGPALSEAESEALTDRLDVCAAGGGETRGPGAYAQVPGSAWREQIVIEA
jgi:hypothetical protein